MSCFFYNYKKIWMRRKSERGHKKELCSGDSFVLSMYGVTGGRI
ncbi:hypothetical protein M2E15_2731 [Bacillus mycoides]|nr:hypothetical protein M2E15_2731 [Bacillus mycoides]OSY04417.1 hypothetical protein S2E19_01751 [Bacillus mycoides]